MVTREQGIVVSVVAFSAYVVFLTWMGAGSPANAGGLSVATAGDGGGGAVAGDTVSMLHHMALVERVKELEQRLLEAEQHTAAHDGGQDQDGPRRSEAPAPAPIPQPAQTAHATEQPQQHGHKRCYVAGVFGGDLKEESWRVRVLAQSLWMAGSRVPVLVMHPREMDSELGFLREQQNIQLYPIDLWDITDSLGTGFNKRHYPAFHKLQAFDIPSSTCRKMAFLDSDMIAMRNPDGLFDAPVLSASVDYPQMNEGSKCYDPHRWMNNGVFVFQHDSAFVSSILSRVQARNHSLLTSQGEMAKYFSWHPLDFNMTVFPHTCRCGDDFRHPSTWHLVHFTWASVKPTELWRQAQYDPNRFELKRPIMCGLVECDCSYPVYEWFLKVASSIQTEHSEFSAPPPEVEAKCFVSGVFDEPLPVAALWGVRVLIESIRQSGSVLPFFLLVPSSVASHSALDVLRALPNVEIIPLTLWDVPAQKSYPRHIHQLQAFADLPPDKCQRFMWLDPDTLVLRNPEKHFSSAGFLSASVDYGVKGDIDTNPSCGFRNTPSLGVVVGMRDEGFVRFVRGFLDNGQRASDPQGLVKDYYVGDRQWKRLPYTVGAFPHSCLCTAEAWSPVSQWDVVHFTWSAPAPHTLWQTAHMDPSKFAPSKGVCSGTHECECARPLYDEWLKHATAVAKAFPETFAQQQHGVEATAFANGCYVTGVFGGSYGIELWRVRVLAQSLLESGSTLPLVVLVSDKEPTATFRFIESQPNIRIHPISLWDVRGVLRPVNQRHALAFHKLQAFEDVPTALCPGKMVFLDTDVLVVNNPDELFEHPHLSASVDYDNPGDRTECGYRNRMNNGVFVFERDPAFSRFVHDKINKRDGQTGTSQQVMSEYFADTWNRLPYRAGAFPHSCKCSSEEWADPTTWLLTHFTWSCFKPGDIWWQSKFDFQTALDNIPQGICQFSQCSCALPVYRKWMEVARRVYEEHTQMGEGDMPEPYGGGMKGECTGVNGEAFVTLISRPEWIPGVVALARSLQLTRTTRPLIVLIPQGGPSAGLSPAERKVLQAEGVRLCDVAHLSNPDKHGQHAARRDCFNKIHPWQLPLRIGVFLDADVAVLRNIDDLFSALDGPDNARFKVAGVQEGKGSFFNSGVFVYRASNVTFNGMVSKLDVLSTWDSGDQGYFDNYFFEAKGDRGTKGLKVLNGTYNFRRSMRMLTHEWVKTWYPQMTHQELEACMESAHKADAACNEMFDADIEKHLHEIRVVHYVSDLKPWDFQAKDFTSPNPRYGHDLFFVLPSLDRKWAEIYQGGGSSG